LLAGAQTRTWAAAGLMVLTAALWGMAPVIFRALAYRMSPLTVAGYRFLIAFLASWLALAAWRRRPWPFRIPFWQAGILAAGVIGVGFGIGAYGWAISQISAVNASFLFYTYPIMVMLATNRPRGGRPAPRTIVALAAAFGGSALVLGAALGHFQGPAALASAALALLAAAAWAFYTVRLRGFGRHTTDATVLTYLPGIAALVLTGLLVDPGRIYADTAGCTPQDWALLLFFGLVVTAVAFLTYNRAIALSVHPATVIIVYLTPLFTVLYSALWLQEPLPPATLAGGGLVLAGILLLRGGTKQDAPDAQAAGTEATTQKVEA
jgi:drug/metabolite transporter (DMT)-like permease